MPRRQARNDGRIPTQMLSAREVAHWAGLHVTSVYRQPLRSLASRRRDGTLGWPRSRLLEYLSDTAAKA